MRAEELSLDNRVRVSGDVVFREIGGEAVLLDLATGVYFGLNEVGTRIWNLLQADGSLRNAFDALRTQYEVPSDQLERDLLDVVGRMFSKGLVLEDVPAPVR